MKLSVTPAHWLEITNKGYSLDQIFMLILIKDNVDITQLCENVKIDVLKSTLVRKGLLMETEEKLTVLGFELLQFMDTKLAGHIKRKKVEDDDFISWWNEFPSTDTFLYSGKKFSGCRTLRQNQEGCRVKFNEYILSGAYTASQMIEALKWDVANKKETSLKSGANKLTYMQNSLTYLNQRSFDAYVGMNETTYKEENIVPEETKNLFG